MKRQSENRRRSTEKYANASELDAVLGDEDHGAFRWRCGKCRRWLSPGDVAVVACAGCDQRAFRCMKTCGGLNAARKGVYLHRLYWARTGEGHIDTPGTKAELRASITWTVKPPPSGNRGGSRQFR